jgi:DNA-binding transcriptional regulator YiaG
MAYTSTKVDGFLSRLQASRLPSPAVRRDIRVSAGVSCRQLAFLIGVTATTVIRWENGATPHTEHAIRYREVLDALQILM